MIKYALKYYIFPVLLTLAGHLALGQGAQFNIDPVNTTLSNALSTEFKTYPKENAFIHTNQSMYVSGQTIWFKIYCMAYGKPTGLSHVIYLQLINPRGSVIKTCKLPLINGAANSDFDLPDNLKTGWYSIKAFTSWMLNFPSDDIYCKKLFIKNTYETSSKAAAVKDSIQKYNFKLFPEGGGDLARDAINTVAFKATNPAGKPVTIHGEIINTDDKQVVVKFVSQHDGMGKFDFEAIPGHYVAKVFFPDGTASYPLPDIKSSVGLRVNPFGQNDIELKFACDQIAAQKNKRCLLAAVQQNGIFSIYPVELSPGTNIYHVKKNKFRTGIVRFTLFSESGAPLLERIVFVNNGDILPMRLQTDSASFTPGKSAIFNVLCTDSSKTALKGDFSVSVTDERSFPEETADNTIVSYFLMSDELKGTINNPAWYFPKDSVKNELDLVMMTNGWRHFAWDSIGRHIQLKFPIDPPIYIAGKIRNFSAAAFPKDKLSIRLTIVNQDSSKFVGNVSPDSTGSFILKNYPFSGTSKIYLQAFDKKGRWRNVQFKLIQSKSDSISKTSPTTAGHDSIGPGISERLLQEARYEQNLASYGNARLLKTVNIRSKANSPTDKLIQSHVGARFVVDPTYTLDLVNHPPEIIGIIDYIKGKFPGLQIVSYNNNAYFVYHGINTLASPPDLNHLNRGESVQTSSAFYPYFYIDEAPATFSDVQDLSLVNVALIRFTPPPVYFAPYNGGNIGALLIYTKKQQDDALSMAYREQFDYFLLNGYSVTREFYSPADLQESPETGISRPCIYWNPHLAVQNGRLRFSFPGSGSGAYRIIIQGMTSDGQVGYVSQVVTRE